MLLDGNQALLGMDDTEVFMSWTANSKKEIQSMLRQLATASNEPEIGGSSTSNGCFWVCRKVLQEAFLSSCRKKFPLFDVSWISDAAPAPGNGQSYVEAPTFSAEAEKSMPGLLLLHKDPAAHHCPPAPPYMHERCCASIKITKICSS